MFTSTQKIEEGFRVLTLRYPITEDVNKFIEKYMVLASHLYWCRRLELKPARGVIKKLWQEVPSYWRWHLVDSKDPLYLFKNVEKISRPHKVVLRIPLVDALHERKGAYIKGNKLVLRLNTKLELEIPERALKWLEKRLAENPDKKYVRVFERDGQLVVQIVFHKINKVEKPRDPLLVVVDINSSYGVVVHFWKEKLVKTLKLRPPNKGNRWVHVKKLRSLRDRLYNQGCITQRQLNVYSMLIKNTLNDSSKTWIQQSVALVVKRIRRIARRHTDLLPALKGEAFSCKQPLVLIDAPDYDSIYRIPLQRTLYSFKKQLENILSWYGVYWEETQLYSTKCPFCESRMKLVEKTRGRRIMECAKCKFKEDRDNMPLCWALKRLSALKGEAST